MSNYDLFGDYEPEQQATLEEDKPEPPRPVQPPRRSGPQKEKRNSSGLYRILTGLFLLGSVGAVAITALLIQNPLLPFNPFPPQLIQSTPTLFVFDFGTATPEQLAGGTRIPTSLPGTPDIVSTSSGESAAIVVPQVFTLPPTVIAFALQNDAVTYTKNTNSKGCDWLSIAGQVLNLTGQPLPGLPVQVKGDGFEQFVFSGTASDFGASGYEVQLNTKPLEAEFMIQLLNTTGQPLSEPVIVRTLNACDSNVAIANFVQVSEWSP
jgi:hypothetical protein